MHTYISSIFIPLNKHVVIYRHTNACAYLVTLWLYVACVCTMSYRGTYWLLSSNQSFYRQMQATGGVWVIIEVAVIIVIKGGHGPTNCLQDLYWGALQL